MHQDLAELKTEAEKLVALLNEPEEGLTTWWAFVNERLDRITEIIVRMRWPGVKY